MTSRLSILVCSAMFAALSLSVGCSGPVDGLGGGKDSPVAVTILPTGGQGPGIQKIVEVEGYGHLKGKITITGSVPSLGPLVTASQVKPDDKDVCVVSKIPNEGLVVNGNAVANVFVFLDRAPAGFDPAKETVEPTEVSMDHQACTFLPHALVVRTGQDIRVLNDDAIPHNVHTYPTRNGSENFGITPDNRTGVTFQYRIAERVPAKIKCDLHTWMTAWHLPLDHPYGAVSNENGEFEIKDIPAGKHKFVIWHEGSKLMDKEVTIEPDGQADLNLEIPAGDFKVAATVPRGPKPRTVVLSTIR